ncbi:hypothetical protein P3T39_002403 [Kitasatospora sp. GP82]|nr:hypothetical protein [Kitasatospora sp. GP82]
MITPGDLLDEISPREGDSVLLGSSGMGFGWGITALEYRG